MARPWSLAVLVQPSIPSPDSFRLIDGMPVLGTGKLELKRLKEVALEEFQVSRQQ